ncbi:MULTISPECIES: ABC transporter permease [Cellulomonas]|uniref:ABC transporter permease n=1 Tax=Cellulomonas TaxID=1707 RepID=UPI0006259B5A|nr:MULTISPECIES: ABC transporter permease [Cellulomonas]
MTPTQLLRSLAPRRDGRAGTAAASWRTPVTMAVLTLTAALAAALGSRTGTTSFRLSEPTDVLALPTATVPAQAATVALTLVMAALCAAAALRVRAGRPPARALAPAFGTAFVLALLTWAAAGATVPVVGLLGGALALSIPLVFGAMGGVLSERVGVVNVAIEGQLLAGACVSAVVATVTGQPLVGLVAAVVAGALVATVLAVFSVRYLVDQVIVGIVLNVLVTGLTGFFYSTALAPDAARLNAPARLPQIALPVLGDLPVVGPVLFRQTVVVYAMYVVVAVVWVVLFRTRQGLRIRAVGEHPEAADTVGIDVRATRVRVVALAGAVAGLGGAYFTLGSVGGFGKDMTAGAGFIALAAVILGGWHPLRAAAAALLFGFVSNLQNVLGIVGSPLPSELMLMLPYLVTVLAVAGVVGKVRAPAASGTAYEGAS